MKQMKMVPPPEMQVYLATLPKDEGEGYRRFRQMTERFRAFGGDGEGLLLTWQLLTQLSHGSAVSAMMFLSGDSGPGGIPSVRAEPQFAADLGLIYSACLDSLLLGLDVLSSVIEGDPARADVQETHNRKAQVEAWLASG